MVGPSNRAAAALRKKAEAALKLERQGRHEEAIARVNDLAARHDGSALVFHLAGHVHHTAARRAVDAGDGKATAHHIVTAHGYLAKAKRLVPNCIAISDLLARVLFMGLKADEAEKEAREAVNIASPVDPADNSVVYTVGRSNSTRDQRVGQCRTSARENLSAIERWMPRLVKEVLDLNTDGNDGAREALKKAKELAKRNPSSSRAQLLSAYMQLQRVRALDPDMDRRPFLDRIRVAMEETIANNFGGSLVLAMFHAKLCFVLGLYETLYFECARGFAIPEPVDPKLEDVPPDSVQGDEYDDRLRSVYGDLRCLLDKLFLVADDFRCSMTSEKQDGFLSVGLVELQEYYGKYYENYQWDAETTISDALSFVNKNMSWRRFWLCPFCDDGKEFTDPNSLLEHMNSKHLPKLRSVFDSKLSEYIILDDYLDRITVYQDSEGHHFFRFNKTDYVLGYLPIPTEEMSFSVLLEEKRERGKEILTEIKDKLKRLPAEKLSSEFDKARLEIQNLLSYYIPASKISNNDIDEIFPHGEVHAEVKVGRSELHPNSNIADVQSVATGLKYLPSISNENSASNLLGSSSKSSEETSSISIYRKSIEVLNKDTDSIIILNVIIQMLWNLRCFRDEFLKRRPVCTLPCHEGPCISQMLYDIFSAWEKDDHHITSSLISIRDTIHQVSNDSTVIQNVEVNTSTYIVITILNGLKMPEVFLEAYSFNLHYDTKIFETLRQAANPEKVLCNKEINCGGFGIKESTTCDDKLDADSLQIAEVKSFADEKCRQVDKLPVSMLEFYTLASYIVPSEGGNQRTLREVITDPDLVLYRFRSTTPDTFRCTFVSMIFYHEGKLLSIVRDQNKWLVFVYNDDVATEFNSWEDLLRHYGDHEIHPGVCFFDNIKIIIQ